MMELYVNAVAEHFGSSVDYGRIEKSYDAEPVGAGRYSRPKVVAVMSPNKKPKTGRPPIPKESRCSNILLVRLREDERRKVEASARESGKSLSEFVRERILERVL